MSSAPSPQSRFDWRYIRRSLWQITLVLVIYILSAGPLYWRIFEAYHLNGNTFLAQLYLPLLYLYDVFPPLRWFLDWWAGLWVL